MGLIDPPEMLDTKTYPFQRVRYMLEHLVPQEGVWGAGDLKVSQRGAGANMSVDVAAGAAFVKGDTGTRQGIYHLVNDGVVNLAVPAAHGSLPRVDQVIARIFDSSVSGGSDTPTLSILQGTATASAQCADPTAASYRAGAAALPSDAIRLADIHVPATDTTITDNQIANRRQMARGATAVSAITAGPTFSGAGTVLGAILMECSGLYPVEVGIVGYASNQGSDTVRYTHQWNIETDDASPVFVARFSSIRQSDAAPMHCPQRIAPAAGLHEFRLICSAGSTSTIGLNQWQIVARELTQVAAS